MSSVYLLLKIENGFLVAFIFSAPILPEAHCVPAILLQPTYLFSLLDWTCLIWLLNLEIHSSTKLGTRRAGRELSGMWRQLFGELMPANTQDVWSRKWLQSSQAVNSLWRLWAIRQKSREMGLGCLLQNLEQSWDHQVYLPIHKLGYARLIVFLFFIF